MENDLPQKKPEQHEAEKFLAKLGETLENTFYPKMWLEKFCLECWNFEEKERKDCFAALSKAFNQMPNVEKAEIIILLINQSKVYPKFCFLAKELFDSLSVAEQKRLTIPMIYWTRDDKETHITQAEYQWRLKHYKPCWRNENGNYMRPINWRLDLKCFEAVIQMMMSSESETLFYLPGYKD